MRARVRCENFIFSRQARRGDMETYGRQQRLSLDRGRDEAMPKVSTTVDNGRPHFGGEGRASIDVGKCVLQLERVSVLCFGRNRVGLTCVNSTNHDRWGSGTGTSSRCWSAT
jgi:hypothetical protein